MVEGQADIHHGTDGDSVFDDHGLFLDGLGGQNSSLGIVNDWAGAGRAQCAGVV